MSTTSTFDLLVATSFTGSLAGATGLPVSTGLSGLGTGAATLLADLIDPDQVWMRDDFIGGYGPSGVYGQLAWGGLNITSAASFGWVTGEANRWGIVRLTTNTADNDGAVLTLNYDGAFSEVGRIPPLNATTGWRLRYIVRINSTASISLRFGLTNDPNNIQPDAWMGWQYDTDAADTNFSAVCRLAAAETKTASGTAADTSFHVFDIFCDLSGTISFSIDGGTAITIATNVPTGATSPFFAVVTRTTAAKTADIDYFGLRATVTR